MHVFPRYRGDNPYVRTHERRDTIVCHFAAGMPGKRLRTVDGRTSHDVWMTDAEFALVNAEWTDTDVLYLATPGAAHVVLLFREAGHGRILFWNINLQEPLRRTSIGFDY